MLNEVQALSIQFFPIFINDDWWGTFVIDDRVQERLWNEDEILFLGAAVEMIKSSLQRWQAEAQLHQLNEQLEQQVEKRAGELSHTVNLLQRSQ